MKVYTIYLAAVFYSSIGNIHTLSIVPQSVDDHFWRDFNGLVPSDAVVGGADANELSTHIAQFTVAAEYGQQQSKVHLIPATVHKGSVEAYAPYNGRVLYSNGTTNVKVLCASYLSKYKWYSITSTFPVNCRLVITGFEDQTPMYTGKATLGREVVTGKIFSDNLNHQPGLIIPLSTGEISVLDEYEVLTYCG